MKKVKAWGLKYAEDGSVYRETFFYRNEACARRDEIYWLSGDNTKVIHVEIREIQPRKKAAK